MKGKLLFFLVSILMSVSLYSAEYSRMYVFGDSLSDVGNVKNTQAYNDGGRWSNGMVWNEYLANMLKLSVPKSSNNYIVGESPDAGNTNFACGGAMTSHGTTEVVIPSIHQQITERNFGQRENVGFERYGVNFNADDLVLIWGGANNLFFSLQTLVKENFADAGIRAANNMITNLEALIAKGAKNIVTLNLPDIGITPAYEKGSQDSKNATEFSEAFNYTYELAIESLRLEQPDVSITLVDAYGIFNDICANPELYGVDNFTDQYISNYEDAQTKNYLFYDDVHPTTYGHKLIAEAVYAAIPEPAEWATILGGFALFLVFFRKRK